MAKFEARIEDRLQIQELLTRYCYAVDTRNWELFRTVFMEDALIDYSANYFGSKGSVNDMIDYISQNFVLFSQTSHMWSNVEITFTGPNNAKVRAALNNPLYLYGL